MGLTDAPATPALPASPAKTQVATDPAVEALQGRLRRVESIAWVLAAAVVVLAVAVVVLLLR
jgi:hypothetical protein